jgi:hypothetical protein
MFRRAPSVCYEIRTTVLNAAHSKGHNYLAKFASYSFVSVVNFHGTNAAPIERRQLCSSSSYHARAFFPSPDVRDKRFELGQIGHAEPPEFDDKRWPSEDVLPPPAARLRAGSSADVESTA